MDISLFGKYHGRAMTERVTYISFYEGTQANVVKEKSK